MRVRVYLSVKMDEACFSVFSQTKKRNLLAGVQETEERPIQKAEIS